MALVALLAMVTLGASTPAAADCPILDPSCSDPPPTTTTTLALTTTTTTAPPSTTAAPTTTAKPAATTAPPTTARPQQQQATTAPPTTEPPAPTTTTPSLLVPGPAGGGTQATTVDGTKVASVKNKDNTGQVVALVIAGLLTVALLLGLLTYRFWRNSRPDGPAPGDGSDGPGRRAATVGARG